MQENAPKSVVLVFPGQGSQYVGMGKNFLNHPCYEFFKTADTILDFSLSDLCLHGPEEKLKQTEITQPAVVAHSLAYYFLVRSRLENHKIPIAAVLGHSVGEYAALIAAGALSFEDGIKAVNQRGKFMQKAAPQGVGAMYAILKAPRQLVEQACLFASDVDEKVIPANFNSPAQVVISGHKKACEKAIQYLTDKCETKFRAIELQVSAPFHSPLMQPAEREMEDYLAKVKIHPNHTPYIANINAQFYPAQTPPEQIRNNLISQISGSVRWEDSVMKLPANCKVIEVGPGQVLKGLHKNIRQDLEILSCDQQKTIDEEIKSIDDFILH
jgi:[acyl-carrier-protein] S-malonyltransferase